MTKHKIIKYKSIYDPDLVFYALAHGGKTQTIDSVLFMEVTTDFSRVQYVRADSLKAIGDMMKEGND